MKAWIKAAGIRAIRTWCTVCVSGATLAAVISLITSIAGLPELKGENDDVD